MIGATRWLLSLLMLLFWCPDDVAAVAADADAAPQQQIYTRLSSSGCARGKQKLQRRCRFLPLAGFGDFLPLATAGFLSLSFAPRALSLTLLPPPPSPPAAPLSLLVPLIHLLPLSKRPRL